MCLAPTALRSGRPRKDGVRRLTTSERTMTAMTSAHRAEIAPVKRGVSKCPVGYNVAIGIRLASATTKGCDRSERCRRAGRRAGRLGMIGRVEQLVMGSSGSSTCSLLPTKRTRSDLGSFVEQANKPLQRPTAIRRDLGQNIGRDGAWRCCRHPALRGENKTDGRSSAHNL